MCTYGYVYLLPKKHSLVLEVLPYKLLSPGKYHEAGTLVTAQRESTFVVRSQHAHPVHVLWLVSLNSSPSPCGDCSFKPLPFYM